MKIFIPILLFITSVTAVWLIPTSAKPAPEVPALASSDRKRTTILSDQRSPRVELAKIARLQDPEDRLLRLIVLANSIPVDQLKDWLTPCALASLDGSLRSLFLTLTCDRWLETAPGDLIRWNSYTDLVDAHHSLARWLLADRDSATSYLRSQPTGSHPGYSMSKSIQNLAKLDFNLALNLAVEKFATLPTHPPSKMSPPPGNEPPWEPSKVGGTPRAPTFPTSPRFSPPSPAKLPRQIRIGFKKISASPAPSPPSGPSTRRAKPPPGSANFPKATTVSGPSKTWPASGKRLRLRRSRFLDQDPLHRRSGGRPNLPLRITRKVTLSDLPALLRSHSERPAINGAIPSNYFLLTSHHEI